MRALPVVRLAHLGVRCSVFGLKEHHCNAVGESSAGQVDRQRSSGHHNFASVCAPVLSAGMFGCDSRGHMFSIAASELLTAVASLPETALRRYITQAITPK